MKEKLIIENFAGMGMGGKPLEMDINRINLLIGPQATGKSVVAKLLYFFKNIVHEMSQTIEREKSIREFNEISRNRFREYFPLDFLGEGLFRIRYEIGEEYFEVKKEKPSNGEMRLFYSGYFENLFSIMTSMAINIRKELKSKSEILFHFNIKNRFLPEVKSKFGPTSIYRQLFIPSGRAYFSNFYENIFEMDFKEAPLEPFISGFGKNYLRIDNLLYGRRALVMKLSEKKLSEKLVNDFLEKLLIKSIVKEGFRKYLIHNDGRKVLISYSSSGQQEAVPLVEVLKYLLKVSFIENGVTLYIEEPEAHLFPNTQKDLVGLFSSIKNLLKMPIQFFLTTHSPYILTSFNNLIEAGIVRDKAKGDAEKLKKLYEIVPKEQILNPKDVTAWTLHDGIAENIMDKETGLINGDEIDDVSDETAEQFGKLLDLE